MFKIYFKRLWRCYYTKDKCLDIFCKMRYRRYDMSALVVAGILLCIITAPTTTASTKSIPTAPTSASSSSETPASTSPGASATTSSATTTTTPTPSTTAGPASSACDTNPCLFGGKCLPWPGGQFVCLCPDGHSPPVCEHAVSTEASLWISVGGSVGGPGGVRLVKEGVVTTVTCHGGPEGQGHDLVQGNLFSPYDLANEKVKEQMTKDCFSKVSLECTNLTSEHRFSPNKTSGYVSTGQNYVVCRCSNSRGAVRTPWCALADAVVVIKAAFLHPIDVSFSRYNKTGRGINTYDLCPHPTIKPNPGVTVKCSMHIASAYPGATFTLVMTAVGGGRTQVYDSCPKTSSCSHTFFPATGRRHTFTCTVRNSAFAGIARSYDMRVDVRTPPKFPPTLIINDQAFRRQATNGSANTAHLYRGQLYNVTCLMGRGDRGNPPTHDYTLLCGGQEVDVVIPELIKLGDNCTCRARHPTHCAPATTVQLQVEEFGLRITVADSAIDGSRGHRYVRLGARTTVNCHWLGTPPQGCEANLICFQGIFRNRTRLLGTSVSGIITATKRDDTVKCACNGEVYCGHKEAPVFYFRAATVPSLVNLRRYTVTGRVVDGTRYTMCPRSAGLTMGCDVFGNTGTLNLSPGLTLSIKMINRNPDNASDVYVDTHDCGESISCRNTFRPTHGGGVTFSCRASNVLFPDLYSDSSNVTVVVNVPPKDPPVLTINFHSFSGDVEGNTVRLAEGMRYSIRCDPGERRGFPPMLDISLVCKGKSAGQHIIAHAGMDQYTCTCKWKFPTSRCYRLTTSVRLLVVDYVASIRVSDGLMGPDGKWFVRSGFEATVECLLQGHHIPPCNRSLTCWSEDPHKARLDTLSGDTVATNIQPGGVVWCSCTVGGGGSCDVSTTVNVTIEAAYGPRSIDFKWLDVGVNNVASWPPMTGYSSTSTSVQSSYLKICPETPLPIVPLVCDADATFDKAYPSASVYISDYVKKDGNISSGYSQCQYLFRPARPGLLDKQYTFSCMANNSVFADLGTAMSTIAMVVYEPRLTLTVSGETFTSSAPANLISLQQDQRYNASCDWPPRYGAARGVTFTCGGGHRQITKGELFDVVIDETMNITHCECRAVSLDGCDDVSAGVKVNVLRPASFQMSHVVLPVGGVLVAVLVAVLVVGGYWCVRRRRGDAVRQLEDDQSDGRSLNMVYMWNKYSSDEASCGQFNLNGSLGPLLADSVDGR